MYRGFSRNRKSSTALYYFTWSPWHHHEGHTDTLKLETRGSSVTGHCSPVTATGNKPVTANPVATATPDEEAV